MARESLPSMPTMRRVRGADRVSGGQAPLHAALRRGGGERLRGRAGATGNGEMEPLAADGEADRQAAGCFAIRASTCTSRPRAPPGSTRSNASLPTSRTSSFDVALIAAQPNSNAPLASTSTSETATPNPSSGPRPPTKSSLPSSALISGSLGRDTRGDTDWIRGYRRANSVGRCELPRSVC